MKKGFITMIDHRPRRRAKGDFDVIRVERCFDRCGELIRHSEAIVSSGWPTQRAARQGAAAAHRMRAGAS
jgi:hypothetical protein